MNDASTLARLTPPARDAFRRWREDPRCEAFWPDLDQRLARASSDDAVLAELEDAFCRPLPIGTGGRRGPVGPGTNRMNEIVLRETAAGLARWVKASGGEMLAVVVYDTRRDSRHFAWVVSHALVAEGMRVRLLDAPRPTPQLSWELRESGAGAGVVISASHNPAGDNGIKIYGPDGAQVLGEDDVRLMQCIVEVAQRGAFAPLDMQAVHAGAWPDEVSVIDPARPDPKFAAGGRGDAGYHEFVLGQGVLAGDLSDAPPVAYTPLHGVGQSAVLPVLGARGLNVSIVDAQLEDGGEFGTVRSANPEAPAALAMVGALAQEICASLAVANDPDADRLGALVRNASGDMEFIDGNRLGVLMLDHLLRHAARPEGARVIITLVTTPLLTTMARAAGLDAVDDILVGFKNHAGLVREDESKPVFFMCEESHGYTRGLQVRDKDGAVAALLLAEAMADAHRAGETLHDRLVAVWAQHGYHRERTRSLWARGAAGRQAIAAAMTALRTRPPSELGGLKVASVVDRQLPRSTGSTTRDLTGNVLVFELRSETQACRLVLRPSGTEPKLKVYALARGPLNERAQVDTLIDTVLEAAEALASTLMAPLLET